LNRLGVLGWPVAHSRSPAIQNAALRQLGLSDWHYQRLPVPPELFDETVRGLAGAGFRGVNVTIPHKEAALALATDASPRARAIGAANTLLLEADGRISADNTDAPALQQALSERVGLDGAEVLVLGAGGSARAAVWALNDAGVGQVRIWNRTPQRATELADELGAHAVAAPLKAADILVNCTSVGLHPDDEIGALPLDSELLTRFSVIVDFVYREGGTPLVRAAQPSGVPTIDGLELLVGQGAIAFELFTGKTAPVQAMRDAVRLSSAP
jgi:shikimate dehydrogenase